MNAMNTLFKTGEERYRAIFDTVARNLHPLVSPYDLSDKNLTQQINFNPVFRSRVEFFAHLILNNDIDKKSKEDF